MNTEKTRAIVIKAIRYGDNSLIVKLLTEQQGLQSFMIKGAYNKNAKIRAALFQPLTLLDIVSANSHGDLGYLKEASVEFTYKDIPINILKNTIVLFICELLSKTIQESETDLELFDFIHNAMTHLDESTDNYADYPLKFAVELSRFLGFSPNTSTFKQGYAFDLEEGVYRHDTDSCTYYIDSQLSEPFHKLCCHNIFADIHLNLTNSERRQLLESMMTYYKLHISGLNEMKSAEILKTVLQPVNAEH